MNNNEKPDWVLIVIIAAIGFIGGISRLLVSTEKIEIRNFIGLGLIGGVLTISVFSVMQFFPETSKIALIGYSGAIATIGADPVRILLIKIANKLIKHD